MTIDFSGLALADGSQKRTWILFLSILPFEVMRAPILLEYLELAAYNSTVKRQIIPRWCRNKLSALFIRFCLRFFRSKAWTAFLFPSKASDVYDRKTTPNTELHQNWLERLEEGEKMKFKAWPARSPDPIELIEILWDELDGNVKTKQLEQMHYICDRCSRSAGMNLLSSI